MASARSQSKSSAAEVALGSIATAVLLTLAAEPFGQWYLAWIALTPWLILVSRAPNMQAALWRGWLTGVLYFAANLWWLWTASIPGTIVLVLYFGLFWAVAAGVLRGLNLLCVESDAHEPARAVYRVIAISVVWVAAEWLRCNVASGFPWLPLGSTQSPLLFMCQIADIGGPWIVSSWVMLPNAVAAMFWLRRDAPFNWRAAGFAAAALLVSVATYGAWRLHSTELTSGPRIMVIQSDFRHLPGGAPTVERQQAVDFFLAELEKHLAEQPADLVVLPEASFPPLNDEARRELANRPVGPFLAETFRRLVRVANDHHTALLAGGTAVTGWSTHEGVRAGSEIRNSAYFFDPRAETPVSRYDKIYLARFSERAPLTIGPIWLRNIAALISAPRAVQPMFAGTLSELRPFRLNWSALKTPVETPSGRPQNDRTSASFITPICLENIDPAVMALMIRGSSPGGKQAEFVANISNDGWFATQEKYQHLQTTIFRCIENRLPMVRCSNTGISAFIDSTGHVHNTIAPNGAGFAVSRIELDNRRTFYTRYGDALPVACVLLSGLAVAAKFFQSVRRKLAQNRATPAKKGEKSSR